MNIFNPQILERIYSLWETDFNMQRIKIGDIDCYEYNGEYYRLDTFFDSNGELLYCVEWARDFNDAKNNIFEDGWLYGEQLGADEIISEMKTDLGT